MSRIVVPNKFYKRPEDPARLPSERPSYGDLRYSNTHIHAGNNGSKLSRSSEAGKTLDHLLYKPTGTAHPHTKLAGIRDAEYPSDIIMQIAAFLRGSEDYRLFHSNGGQEYRLMLRKNR
jgi:hypothetical protein|tara:strand:- start:24712 stop:25068 length:357 start_codon:yes stop_codon:yes gene_type:complete